MEAQLTIHRVGLLDSGISSLVHQKDAHLNIAVEPHMIDCEDNVEAKLQLGTLIRRVRVAQDHYRHVET